MAKGRYLTKVLRHDPGSAGLKLDKASWCEVDKLLPALKLTQQELDKIVDTDNKKRFEYDIDKKHIRASQGHSVEVDLGYKPQEPPEYLWHGTSVETVGAIRQWGLIKMTRHAVHLSADKDTALNVAKRKGTPTALKVLSKMMYGEGFQFYLSTNGVWLVDHVPAKYIE